MRRLLAVIAGAVVLAGCGARDNDDDKDAAQTATTRVEVLRTLDSDGSAPRGGFDPGDVYDHVSPGVVTVIATGLGRTLSGGQSAGQGSGFVVSADGEILTNAHVVTSGTGSRIERASSIYVDFPDGNQVEAKIVGFDPFADVALLKVDPKGLSLRPLPLGSARDVKVGAPVVAIGSPFGEEQSLSVGIVSATERSISSLTGFQTTGAIQTDAAINHGNSGGPLIDAAGRVLGINSQIQTTSGDGTGVGFAVPVETVKRSLQQLRERGGVHYAYLGVTSGVIYPQLAERFKLPTKKGVWVQNVPAGGPADDAGVRASGPIERFQARPWATGGDIIVALGATKIADDDDLAQALLAYEPGDSVDVKLLRDGEPRTVEVKLGERPLSDPDRG